MVCALKRIAVEDHNFTVHGCILVQILSLSGLNYTTHNKNKIELIISTTDKTACQRQVRILVYRVV